MTASSTPIWFEAARPATTFAPLAESLRADVAVVGAGITGLTLATLLREAGRCVVVLERATLASGTTGGTSAHVTAALDVEYATLISRFGADAARRVVDSVVRAIDEIERRAALLGAPDAFARVPGYRFTEREDEIDWLAAEVEIARRLGLTAALVQDVPLPFGAVAALRLEAQGQLHPLRYLDALARRFTAAGGRLFEHTPVVAIEEGAVRVASGHRVEAGHVVDATHTPVGLVTSIQTRLAAQTSHCLVARLERPIGAALFWDTDTPYHYLRTLDADRTRVLIGGADHHTGRDDARKRRRELEEWTRARLPVAAIEARWSAQLFEPADGLPYIGRLPGSKTRLVAAGFSGTGITYGTVAALLLRDLVVDGTGAWADLYAPSRIGPLTSGLGIARENASIAWRFVADRLAKGRGASHDDLPEGEGRIERVDGAAVAVHRDAQGVVHRMSARCPHLGCLVAWNDTEKSWDCPCHGGRFRATGEVLYGPPVAGLERA